MASPAYPTKSTPKTLWRENCRWHLSLYIYIHTYIYTHIYIYINIYIYPYINTSCTSIHLYIYIYAHTHTHMHIYIYIYIYICIFCMAPTTFSDTQSCIGHLRLIDDVRLSAGFGHHGASSVV